MSMKGASEGGIGGVRIQGGDWFLGGVGILDGSLVNGLVGSIVVGYMVVGEEGGVNDGGSILILISLPSFNDGSRFSIFFIK